MSKKTVKKVNSEPSNKRAFQPDSVMETDGLKVGLYNFKTKDNKSMIVTIPGYDHMQEDDVLLLVRIRDEIASWYATSIPGLFENRENGLSYTQRPALSVYDLHLALNSEQNIAMHNFLSSLVISELFSDVVKDKTFVTTSINVIYTADNNPIFFNYYINPGTGETFIFGADPLADGRILPEPVSNTVLSPVKLVLNMVQDISFRMYLADDPTERGTYFNYIYDMGSLADMMGISLPDISEEKEELEQKATQ